MKPTRGAHPSDVMGFVHFFGITTPDELEVDVGGAEQDAGDEPPNKHQ